VRELKYFAVELKLKNTPWKVLIIFERRVDADGLSPGLSMLYAFRFTHSPPQMRPVMIMASPNWDPSLLAAVE